VHLETKVKTIECFCRSARPDRQALRHNRLFKSIPESQELLPSHEAAKLFEFHRKRRNPYFRNKL
jgi:hypothetical protein